MAWNEGSSIQSDGAGPPAGAARLFKQDALDELPALRELVNQADDGMPQAMTKARNCI